MRFGVAQYGARSVFCGLARIPWGIALVDDTQPSAPVSSALSKPPHRLVALLLLTLVLVSFAAQVGWIVGSLPYPRHVDEATFSRSSLHMLQQGTLRPTNFNWPTFPIYLAAAAEGAALVREMAAGRIESRDDVELRVFPYYEQAGLILPAKLLFAAISVASLVLVGFIAARVSGSPWGWVLAPAFLSLNSLYLRHSWSYLNVDIIATFFVVAALATLLRDSNPEEGLAKKVVIPGILCGLAIASKYTQALLVIPFVILLIQTDRRRFFVPVALLAVIVVATFAIAMPYSILDHDRFVHWLARQQEIYSKGWPGHDVRPGLSHLARQLGHLAHQFGPVVFGFGALGLAHTLLRRSRRGIALASYPVVFTVFYSSYRTDFVRNLLPVHALFSAFAAIGLVVLARSLRDQLDARNWPPANARARSLGVFILLAIAVLLAAPWGDLRTSYSNPPDSRNQAVDWISSNLPAGSRVVFARELGFDTRPLESDYSVVVRPFARLAGRQDEFIAPASEFFRREADAGAIFVTPIYGFDERWPERRSTARIFNAVFAGGEELARFGRNPVRVLYAEPAPLGDPSFSLRRGQVFESSPSASRLRER